MRHIHALPAEKVPRDDEFKFRERAKALVDKWHEILSASKATDGAVRKPAANGKPHAEEAGTNGKEEANGKPEEPASAAEESEKKMDVDAKEDAPAPAAEADADAKKDTEKEAEKDAPAEEEAPAAAAEESAGDVTMSEAA